MAEETATLFTCAAEDVGLPRVQTRLGGVAHINIGQHLLDIYSQRHANLVHFPAIGVLCGGAFGSDLALPELGEGSDGEDEIESLRLLARLLKGRRLQLYIPAHRLHLVGQDRGDEAIGGGRQLSPRSAAHRLASGRAGRILEPVRTDS